jgi:hypothetical protein
MDKLYSQYIKAVINHGPTHLKQDWCCTVISLGNHRSPTRQRRVEISGGE